MQKTLVLLLVLFALAFSGCIQPGAKSFSDLKKISENYGQNGTLIPGTGKELSDYKNDLLSLKAQASQQKGKETEALVSAIELDLTLVEMQQAVLAAGEEAKLIDYYDASCQQETNLKKTINHLDKALSQADLATALADNFSKNYSEFLQQAVIDLQKTKRTISESRATVLEQKNTFAKFCA